MGKKYQSPPQNIQNRSFSKQTHKNIDKLSSFTNSNSLNIRKSSSTSNNNLQVAVKGFEIEPNEKLEK